MSEQASSAERRVAILGDGFTAAVAAELLWDHPDFELAAVTSRSHDGRQLDELYADTPLTAAPVRLEHPANVLEDIENWELDAAVVAYPHAEGAAAAADLHENGVRVVDLGAGFRLRDLETYEHWYGPHPTPELLERAVYGLAELYREDIQDAELVANPGCYPTATILGLTPLAGEGLIETVSVKAYSGTSGSGKGGAEQYAGAAEKVIEYGQDGHRHQPEIEQELATLGYRGEVAFQPHVLTDTFQGMLVRCEVALTEDVDIDELRTLYRDAYADDPFVELSERSMGRYDLETVTWTNRCRISLDLDGTGRLMISILIDNLWKGASGQAVQNLNIMHGLPEETGLSALALERSA